MNMLDSFVDSAFDASRAGAFKWTLAAGTLELSPSLLPLLGLTAYAYDGRFETLAELFHHLDRQRLDEYLQHFAARRPHFETEVRVMGANGEIHWFSVQGQCSFDHTGAVSSISGIMQAIAASVAAARRMGAQQSVLYALLAEERIDSLPLEQSLRRLTESAAKVLSAARASVWQLDDGACLRCLSLYRAKERQHEAGAVLDGSQCPRYFEALKRGRTLSVVNAQGDVRTAELSESYLKVLGIQSMLDANIQRAGQTIGVVCIEHIGPMRRWTLDEQHFVASLADMATLLLEAEERRKLAAHIDFAAKHDSLTSLPNRFQFGEYIDAALAAGTPFALCRIDLLDFDNVNQTLGHELGDIVLIHMAARLRDTLGPEARLCRVGGHEFGALFGEVSNEAQFDSIAQAVLAAVKQPLRIDGVRLKLRARMGVSLYPEHGQDRVSLLRSADRALHAMGSRAGYTLYQVERDQRSTRRLALMHDLSEAIERRGFSVVFQPKVNMHNGQVIGVEALSRWAHAEFGAIRPEEFIALAEMGDLIRDLTLEVLRQAAQAWRLLEAQGCGVPVSINLSPYMLHDGRWADEILETLAQTDMPMHCLELEVTENAFVHDAEQAMQAMRKLESMGIRFSLDDFGIGYSSMEHLASMPIHSLKIDRSFVAGVVDKPKSRAIVHSALLLGSELGLSVIAEGVESEAHAQALVAMGCVFAQGYYYGMPKDLAALLAEVAHQAGGTRH